MWQVLHPDHVRHCVSSPSGHHGNLLKQMLSPFYRRGNRDQWFVKRLLEQNSNPGNELQRLALQLDRPFEAFLLTSGRAGTLPDSSSVSGCAEMQSCMHLVTQAM